MLLAGQHTACHIARCLKASGLLCKLNHGVEQGDPRDLPRCLRACFRPASPNGVAGPLFSSPEQVSWTAAPLLPLAGPPGGGVAATGRRDLQGRGQQEIPTSTPLEQGGSRRSAVTQSHA